VRDINYAGINSVNPKQVSPGEVLGHYLVEEFLAQGGWSAVYRARDLRLERTVALKVLLEGLQGDDATWGRTLSEARLASTLSHPNICTTYDVGEDEGRAYVAMEYIAGRRLSDHIRHGGLPVSTVISYGEEIAAALAHAHEHGIIHGDVKSSNVLITDEGIAKLVDFGLAKRFGPEDLKIAMSSRSSLAEIGRMAGTLSYLAPEVLRGKPTTVQSDIWALGILLHEMAYGDLPFSGETPFELSTQIMTGQREALALAIPHGLNAVIEGCTEKDPTLRYQTAGEVLEELDRASTAWSREPREHASAWVRRILFRSGLAAALLVGLILVVPFAGNLMLRRNALAVPTPVPARPRRSLPNPPTVTSRSRSTRKPVVERHEPDFRDYYEEFLARGKTKMQPLLAVAHKLLDAIYGMFRPAPVCLISLDNIAGQLIT
jgi:serine/threonine protein kinase